MKESLFLKNVHSKMEIFCFLIDAVDEDDDHHDVDNV